MKNIPFKNFKKRKPEVGQVCLYKAGTLGQIVVAAVEVTDCDEDLANVKLRYVIHSPSRLKPVFTAKAADLFFKVELSGSYYQFTHPYFPRLALAVESVRMIPGVYLELPEKRVVKVESIDFGESTKLRIKISVRKPTSEECTLLLNRWVKPLVAEIVWKDLSSA